MRRRAPAARLPRLAFWFSALGLASAVRHSRSLEASEVAPQPWACPPSSASQVGPASCAQPPVGQRLPVEVVRCVLDLVPWPFQVAWSGGRGTGYLWSPWSQLPVQTMRAHRAYVNDIKFFPGGERLATAGGDGSVIIWRTMRGELLRTLRGHATGAEVRQIQIFPEGDRLVSVGSDAVAIVWSADTGEVLAKLEQQRPWWSAHCVARVFPGSGKVATGASHRTVNHPVIWNATDGTALHHLRQDATTGIRLLEVSASGQLVVTADDRRAWVWDAATGTIRQGLLLGPSGDITGVAFADGEDKVVACSADGSITIWSVTSGLLRRLGVGSPIFGMAAIPGQDRVVTFGSHLVMVWNATSGKPLRALDNSGNLQGLTVSSSGEVVAACRRSETGRAQQSVAIWDTSTGSVLHELRVPIFEVQPPWRQQTCNIVFGVGTPPLEI